MRKTWTESANSLIDGARLSAGYCTQIEILENAIRTLADVADTADRRLEATRRPPCLITGQPERLPKGPYDYL